MSKIYDNSNIIVFSKAWWIMNNRLEELLQQPGNMKRYSMYLDKTWNIYTMLPRYFFRSLISHSRLSSPNLSTLIFGTREQLMTSSMHPPAKITRIPFKLYFYLFLGILGVGLGGQCLTFIGLVSWLIWHPVWVCGMCTFCSRPSGIEVTWYFSWRIILQISQ